jgi:hypothetical protein
MKRLLFLVAVSVAAGAHGQTFFDDFNRADGGLGANWQLITGPQPIISSNRAIGGGTGNGITLINSAVFSGAYDLQRVEADVSVLDQSSTLAYSALILGGTGTTTAGHGVFVKLQRQVAGGFSHIGIYSGVGQNHTGITTAGGNFQALPFSFSAARLAVWFSDPTTLQVGIDTDFNNVYDITYTSTVNLSTMVFGNRAGMHIWGNLGTIDNYSATIVPEPATLLVLGLGALALRRRRR